MTAVDDQLLKAASAGGMTPLANAASRGHFDVAQILLDRGARVTGDLLSILQTKVNILEENREAGMVTEEGVASWKQGLDFFITQRMKQDLPDLVPRTASADPVERREAATRVAEAAQRGIDVTAAASHLPALLADADPETRRHAGSAFTHHLSRVDGSRGRDRGSGRRSPRGHGHSLPQSCRQAILAQQRPAEVLPRRIGHSGSVTLRPEPGIPAFFRRVFPQ